MLAFKETEIISKIMFVISVHIESHSCFLFTCFECERGLVRISLPVVNFVNVILVLFVTVPFEGNHGFKIVPDWFNVRLHFLCLIGNLFSVLTKFNAKDTSLHMEDYHAATNLGLLQANMTSCHRNRGPQYHWTPELYSKMGLPVLDGIQEMVCIYVCSLLNDFLKGANQGNVHSPFLASFYWLLMSLALYNK